MPQLDSNTEAAVRSFVYLIEKDGIPVSDVRVFGSRARGTAKKHSDIDVCIVSPTFGKNHLEETGQLLRIASRLPHSLPLEPIALSAEDLEDPWSSLAEEIRRDGIPLKW